MQFNQQARSQYRDEEDEEDELEASLMRAVEAAIEDMPAEHRLILQHVARAECMGVEVIFLNALPRDQQARDTLAAAALRRLRSKLIAAGVLLD